MTNRILEECLRIAQKDCAKKNHPGYFSFKHWSFIIQGNKILGYGKNRSGKPTYNFGYRLTAKIHSEIDVYSKTKGIIAKNESFEIVNIRLNKQGDMRLSKPCSCCLKFLKFIGCNTVYFSTEEGFVRLKI